MIRRYSGGSSITKKEKEISFKAHRAARVAL